MLNINGSPSAASVTLQALSPASKSVAEGYYAATNLDTVDADLAVANIKTGVVVFGLTGTYDVEAANPITAGVIQTGKIGFVNGAKITGNGTKTLDPAANTFVAGYYAGDAGGLSAVDTDLVTGNIRSTITIFGVAGKAEVVDTTEAVGDAADNTMIALGKKAWVNGVEITGIHV
jgi:hypothetical protein